jgi:hypothetical protein
MRRRIHAYHMRRRIHAYHMRRRIHACHEEEDTCVSYEEEDTCTIPRTALNKVIEHGVMMCLLTRMLPEK